jgi:hypothetical protein
VALISRYALSRRCIALAARGAADLGAIACTIGLAALRSGGVLDEVGARHRR